MKNERKILLSEIIANILKNENATSDAEIIKVLRDYGYHALRIKSQDGIIFIKTVRGYYYVLSPTLICKMAKFDINTEWGRAVVDEFKTAEQNLKSTKPAALCNA